MRMLPKSLQAEGVGIEQKRYQIYACQRIGAHPQCCLCASPSATFTERGSTKRAKRNSLRLAEIMWPCNIIFSGTDIINVL
jgi:hypothetical protein